ncbi:hypothetical protein K438DRAFT_1997599 [Mycena galopus ATCC 62051]|nr:hypothetical protein K438DRAFT_1997599 [Mycena galopus ATCC 62051]
MSYFRLPYRRQRGVDNHSGSIIVLTIMKDGKTLATGAEEHQDVLYSGTQHGYFVCWRRDKESKAFEETFATQITNAGEITVLVISKDANTGLWRVTNILAKDTVTLFPGQSRSPLSITAPTETLSLAQPYGPVYTLCGASGETRLTSGVQLYIGGIAVNWSEGVFASAIPTMARPLPIREPNQNQFV